MKSVSLLRSLLLLSLLLGLAACAQRVPLVDTLNPWVGGPVSTVFDRLGMPDSEGTVAGRKFYAWEHEDGKRVDEKTNGSVEITTYRCKVRAFVDEEDIVRFFDVQGNVGGCDYYR